MFSGKELKNYSEPLYNKREIVVANKMVFNSYSWVAADNAQIEDRIYRLTQKNDVTCVYQLFNDSMSKHMYDTVIGKKNMMDTIIKSEINK